jgi:hypothetical protein
VGPSHKNKIARPIPIAAPYEQNRVQALDVRTDSRPQRREHPMAALFRLLFTRSVISIA